MRGRRSHPTQLSTLELKRPSRHLVTPRQPRLRCSSSKQQSNVQSQPYSLGPSHRISHWKRACCSSLVARENRGEG